MTRRLLTLTLVVSSFALAQDSQQAQWVTPSDELNAQLPSWLRFSGEYRGRMEGFTGGGYKHNNDDLYYLNRLRLNMQLKPTSWLKFYFQAQDARVFGKNQHPPAPPFQDTMDIRMAYVEIGDTEKGILALRAGRQEINFGEQRLIGAANWLNEARTFDAVRATFHATTDAATYRLDVFSASVVNPVDGTWDHHQQGNDIHGLYGGIERLVPDAVIEPYLFWRVAPWTLSPVQELGGRANLNQKTGGIRFVGKLPGGFDYGTEMVKQFGVLGRDSISAWAGEWRLGYTLRSVRWTPHLLAEFNYATGDSNAKDGTRQTFDPLYPTAHDKYGLADQVGWRNIEDIRVGVETKPNKKWTTSTIFHDWWLASAKDALYAANGLPIARVAAGTADRHVGEEIDVQAMHTFTKQIQAGGGFGHIFPGQFLKKATPGNSYNFPYLMLTYGF